MIDAADAIANVKLTLIFSIFKTLDDLHLKALANVLNDVNNIRNNVLNDVK